MEICMQVLHWEVLLGATPEASKGSRMGREEAESRSSHSTSFRSAHKELWSWEGRSEISQLLGGSLWDIPTFEARGPDLCTLTGTSHWMQVSSKEGYTIYGSSSSYLRAIPGKELSYEPQHLEKWGPPSRRRILGGTPRQLLAYVSRNKSLNNKEREVLKKQPNWQWNVLSSGTTILN